MQFVSQMNPRTTKRDAFWLFMIGCFSMTQLKLGAKIGISEAGCLLAMPFIFARDYVSYRRDGVSLYFKLALFWIVGALFSDFYNHSFFEQVIRGFSVPLLIFSVSVCIYHFLRRNPANLKCLLFGMAVSSVISIFVFQRGSAGDLAAEGDVAGAIEAVVGYKLFWANMAMTWLLLPVQAFYLQTPRLYVVVSMLAVAFINATVGGRSAFAVSMLAFLLVMIGGKNITTMRRIRRYLPGLVLLLIVFAFAIKGAYSFAATHGYLSEEETVKYQRQTAKGSDIKSLLIAGRGDFFIGLFAALDKPLIGHGSQAFDTYGYEEEYLERYGTDQDQLDYMKARAMGRLRTIRAHSHVICYWMWHGVAGLLFWVYVFYLVIQTVHKRMDLMPEWFGFLAIALSAFLWDYFFSPFGLRVTECTLFCALLILVKMEKDRKRGLLPSL